jgi:hypothetical protein
MLLLNKRGELLKLPEDTTAIFLGNSTFEYGIDDSLLPHTRNFAINSEPIDLVYAKLKLLKRYNPQINKAYVEFDDIILYKETLPIVLSHPFFLDCLNSDDISSNIKTFTFERNMSYFSHVYDAIKIRPLLLANLKHQTIDNLGIGGYHDLYREKLKADINIIKSRKKKVKLVPKANVHYYQAIINYCSDNNIQLIFLTTPKHKIIEADTLYRDFYKKSFSKIRFVDCNDLALPDSCFGDTYHLNVKGARAFSDYLRIILN